MEMDVPFEVRTEYFSITDMSFVDTQTETQREQDTTWPQRQPATDGLTD